MQELALLHQDGVFLRREALARGYVDADLALALRRGEIARIRHGAYVPRELLDRSDPAQLHRLRAHAVLRSHRSPLALSHTSAAVEHGMRLHRPALERVHVLCLDKAISRTTRDVVYHEASADPAELVLLGECPVVGPARAALEAAMLLPQAGALVVLDSVIDLKLATAEELAARHATMTRWPGARRLQIPLRLARPGANSVGESLARHLMWRHSIPEPVLQYEIFGPGGRLLGRSDFAWPEHGLLGEFDGLSKYGRLLRPDETAQEAVVREKVREDQLREATGWPMIRLIWDDLRAPARTAERLRESLRRAQSLRR